MDTYVQESDKIESWCKRFLIFMINQGVECRKSDLQRWNKAIMWNKVSREQKQKSDKNKTVVATCSFVAVGGRQLPQLQGFPEKALSTLSGMLKKYGSVLWFIVIEKKVFVIFHVFTLKQATKLLKDLETNQVHNNVVNSLKADLTRANSRFKGMESLVTTFCPSDVLEIRNKVIEAEGPQRLPIRLDEKVSSQSGPQQPPTELEQKVSSQLGSQKPSELERKVSPQDETHVETQVGKIAPFLRNQPVEVFSKTTGQWVTAKAICVQEDSEGIFVTVKRIDGLELDYDIENVRPVTVTQAHLDHTPMLSKDSSDRQMMIHDNQSRNVEQDDFETYDKPDQEYSDEDIAPAQMDDGLTQPNKPRIQPMPSYLSNSDAEWFKRIETFDIYNKIRTVKTWLYGIIEKNEPLNRMIEEQLQEVCEMLPKFNQ
jgi:hypothetical protein